MKLENILKGISLPAIYEREGKPCYYDTYRKKLIEITPEETVRQKIASLFEKKYGVPREMIALEVPMSHYVDGVSGRADIIIHAFDAQTQSLYPITIIECKNEDVFLTDKVAEQAIRYCDVLAGKYIVITNGNELRMATYDELSNTYIFLNEILSYEQMINNDFSIPETKNIDIKRFSFDELKNQNLISMYNNDGPWIFGESTSAELRTLAVNLYQALLDIKHKLPPIKKNSFELIEDIGERYMDYGNAGGGHYNGIYRAFLVKDRFGDTQIVSISIFGTDANFRGENRTSYTSLTVAIDRFKTSHNSLQYNMDRFVKISPNGNATFIHNGQISGIKNEHVINMIKTHGDGVHVNSVEVNLGNIDSNKLLYLKDDDVSNLIYNLIEYALLREDVRKEKRK